MSSSKKEMLTVKLIPIAQMDCSTCVPLLEREIMKLNGVREARGNYITKILKVTYDSGLVRLAEIEGAIEHAGYQVAYKQYPSVTSRIAGLFRKRKPSKVILISDAEFTSKVLHSSKPALVLFASPTCPPCQMAKEVYSQAAEELGEQAGLYEMDVTASETWHNYDITVTPTVLIFIDGFLRKTLIPLSKKEEIINALSKKSTEKL